VGGELDEARGELGLDDDLDVGPLLHEQEAVRVDDEELVVVVERTVARNQRLGVDVSDVHAQGDW